MRQQTFPTNTHDPEPTDGVKMALPVSVTHMVFRTLLSPFGTDKSSYIPCTYAPQISWLTVTSPYLKERLYGLSNSQGNHGECVKEAYFHLDNTPVCVPPQFFFSLSNR